MSKISPLHNIKHKAAFGSGAVGIGLGTLLVAIAPKITDDAKIIETLKLLSPTVSIIGAYISTLIIRYIRTYYLVWAANKIETKIDTFLENPDLSPQHIQNLKTKREEMQRKQIESLEQGLINDEEASISAPNKSLKRTSKLPPK